MLTRFEKYKILVLNLAMLSAFGCSKGSNTNNVPSVGALSGGSNSTPAPNTPTTPSTTPSAINPNSECNMALYKSDSINKSDILLTTASTSAGSQSKTEVSYLNFDDTYKLSFNIKINSNEQWSLKCWKDFNSIKPKESIYDWQGTASNQNDKLPLRVIDFSNDNYTVGCEINIQDKVSGLGPKCQFHLREDIVPVKIAAYSYHRLSAGGSSAASSICGLNQFGRVFCNGLNSSGQLADGTIIDRNAVDFTRVRVLADDLASGLGHTCAINKMDKSVRCWGLNNHGQVGVSIKHNVSGTLDYVPIFNQGLEVEFVGIYLKNIVAGLYHTCGLTTLNKVVCWGDNTYGQLGRGHVGGDDLSLLDSVQKDSLQILDTSDYAFISAHENSTCGITTLGALKCWGQNNNFQLGLPSTIATGLPTQVSDTLKFKQVALADSHACAITNDDDLLCWGNNIGGAISNHVALSSLSKNMIMADYPNKYAKISVNNGGSCGITLDKKLKCWGTYSKYQQFYIGDATPREISMPVSLGTNFTEIFLTENEFFATSDTGSMVSGAGNYENNGIISVLGTYWQTLK